MAKCLASGYVEPVPLDELNPINSDKTWFLPIFPVTHRKKKKTRLVFDSSAKFQGVSLNSVLLRGPDENNKLRGVMIRFRMGEVAIGGDVANMFYNFFLPEGDKDFLRFYWFMDNNPGKDLCQYRDASTYSGTRVVLP